MNTVPSDLESPWRSGMARRHPALNARRQWTAIGVMSACVLTGLAAADAEQTLAEAERLQMAAVVTEYRTNTHADVIVGRLLETHTMDGQGRVSPLGLKTLFTDQLPDNDISRHLAQRHGFAIAETVKDALLDADGALAVAGLLLVAEHGQYPRSDTGAIQYPKRRLFEQVLEAFDAAGRVAPVFIDKHVADDWADIDWMIREARRRDIPLMAGSSVPLAWRQPAVDVPRGAELAEILAVSYHTLDAYGFHALEVVQSLAERRAGGETGVTAVRCLTGEAVWQAGRDGLYDPALLEAALDRMQWRRFEARPLEEAVRNPTLFEIHYADGLRAYVLTLPGVVREWSAAWRDARGKRESALFRLQEERPFMHFSLLLSGIEQMMLTRQPSWPVERTVMSSGILDALLHSRAQDEKLLATPHLNWGYASDWDWAAFMAGIPEPEP